MKGLVLITWIISAAVSITSTRYIIRQQQLHYPYYLLLAHLLAALVLHLPRLLSSSPPPTEDTTETIWRDRRTSTQKLYQTALVLLHIGSIIGALECAYKAILRTPTMATLMMTLTLGWRPIFIVCNGHERQATSLCKVIRIFLFVAGGAVVYLSDYQLNQNGVSLALVSAGLIGLAEATGELFFVTWAQPDQRRTDGREANIRMVALAVALPITALLAWMRDPPLMWMLRHHDLPTMAGILALNICASAIALRCSPVLFRWNGDVHTAEEAVPVSPFGYAAQAFGLSGLVLAGTIATGAFTVVSRWQILGFVVATAALLRRDEWESLPILAQQNRYELVSLQSVNVMKDEEEVTEPLCADEGGKKSVSGVSSYTCAMVALMLAGISTLLFLSVHHRNPFSLPQMPTSLERDFKATRTLDIVVSRYHEAPEDIADILRLLLRTPGIVGSSPKVWLYDKNQTEEASRLWTDLEAGLPSEAEFEAVPLQNVGREGDTFLHHIIDRWDDLANHTVFLQGHPHEPHAMLERIAHYYVPETGFLSLSRVGQFCEDCATCVDHSRTWTEEATILQDIYSRANSGAACRDLALTYRGQFIASAARMRGNDRAMYQRLRNRLDDASEGETADQTYQRLKYDLANEVRTEYVLSGYTLERMWGAIMQCSGPKVAMECPTLLSGRLGHVAPLDACQCLDT